MYAPLNYFSKVFISSFPSAIYFYFISGIGLLSCFFLIVKNSNTVLFRCVLFFAVLWLNTWHWSFGFASHVGHVFLLFHLFTLFIPIQKAYSKQEYLQVSNMIRLFLVGIVVIYTWSAAWKIVTITYKIFYQPGVMTWLYPDAQLINAVSGHILMEENLGWKLILFQIPIVWQMLFIGIVLFMMMVPLLVLNPRLLSWIFFVLILFHATNFIITRAEFITVPTIYVLFIVSGWIRSLPSSYLAVKI